MHGCIQLASMERDAHYVMGRNCSARGDEGFSRPFEARDPVESWSVKFGNVIAVRFSQQNLSLSATAVSASAYLQLSGLLSEEYQASDTASTLNWERE